MTGCMKQGILQEGGGAPRSNEISTKMRNVGPLKYTLIGNEIGLFLFCVFVSTKTVY